MKMKFFVIFVVLFAAAVHSGVAEPWEQLESLVKNTTEAVNGFTLRKLNLLTEVDEKILDIIENIQSIAGQNVGLISPKVEAIRICRKNLLRELTKTSFKPSALLKKAASVVKAIKATAEKCASSSSAAQCLLKVTKEAESIVTSYIPKLAEEIRLAEESLNRAKTIAAEALKCAIAAEHSNSL